MHIKFLAHGTGDPQRAVAYLLAMHDHNSIPRPMVKVLRGNPQQVADLAETLPFVHGYTSGVISWHADDDPSLDEVNEVLDDFMRVAFAGLEPDQYACSAVWHGGHVHIFAARVELRSGLSHNMAPPGWEDAFDSLRDYWNFKMGWASPADPRRARQVQPGPLFKANLSALRRIEADELLGAFAVEPDLQGREQRKAAVVEWIRGRVLAGAINSREDLILSLGQIGELTRVSHDFISIRMEEDGKALRLKGTLFDERFDAGAIRATEMNPVQVVGLGREEPNLEAAATSKAVLEDVIKRRAIYNQGRYKAPSPSSVSASVPPRALSTIEEVASPTLEKIYDRTGNHFIAQALRALNASRNAIRRLTLACREAVRTFAELDRASESLERASRILEGIGPALIQRRTLRRRYLGVVKQSMKP